LSTFLLCGLPNLEAQAQALIALDLRPQRLVRWLRLGVNYTVYALTHWPKSKI